MTTRGWQLGAQASEDPLSAWDEVALAMDVPSARLVRVRQVHGVDVLVRRVGAPAAPDRPDADIIISNDASVAIAIQAADCVPLLVADRRSGVVAAAHAGWRGLAANVPETTVDALVREFGSRPQDLFVALGPSVGPCCYEVGADVRERLQSAGTAEGLMTRWFHARPEPSARNPSMAGLPPVRAGHWYFDLWSAARDRLEAAGVPSDQIHTAELCTASHPHVLCSYRRDGRGAGRMAGAIRAR